MTNRETKIRPGLTAIAAVLALSTTPLKAQEVPPAESVAEAAPATTAAPSESTVTPTTTETTTAAADPLAPVAEPVAKKAASTIRSVKRTTTKRVSAPVRSTRAASPAAPVAPVAVETSEPAPLAAAAPLPAPPVAEIAPVAEPGPPPVATTEVNDGDMLPIAGAAGLGILVLAGAGMAMRRRKLNGDEYAEAEWQEPAFATPAVERAPVREPVRNAVPVMAAAPAAIPEGVDAASLGRHVRAAYAGPTPENPSLSLKKRLKRAAFFDQRERMAAAGKAKPISLDAGLPDNIAKPAVAKAKPVRTPFANGYGFNARFQPA